MAEKKEAKKTKRPTALKRDLQNQKRTEINGAFKSRLRTAVRKFESELVSQASEQQQLTDRLNALYSLTDKGVKRGVLTLNKAKRIKSRFASKLQKRA